MGFWAISSPGRWKSNWSVLNEEVNCCPDTMVQPFQQTLQNGNSQISAPVWKSEKFQRISCVHTGFGAWGGGLARELLARIRI